jgi:hypothetical protein
MPCKWRLFDEASMAKLALRYGEWLEICERTCVSAQGAADTDYTMVKVGSGGDVCLVVGQEGRDRRAELSRLSEQTGRLKIEME